MEIQQVTLENNLNTVFLNVKDSPSSTVQIWFRAGSALEEEGDRGIAHFLEHMFFKGSKKRPGSAIAHEVESFGGEINAFTSFDYTCYYIQSPNPKLTESTEILMDMVCNPTFLEEELIPERDVVFEEYRRSQDDSNHFCFQKMQNTFFKGTYSHPILGQESTIKNFSRQQLLKFREENYNLENALLIVSGDLDKNPNIKKTIESFRLPSGKESAFPQFNLKNSKKIEVHQKETRMCQLNIYIEAPDYNSENGPLEDLAMGCFGYGETSPLYKDLITESAYANKSVAYTMFMNKGGCHLIKVVFPFSNIKKVISTLSNTLVENFKNGLQKEDIQKIKNQYIASKIYEKETLESYSSSLGHGYAQAKDIYSEEKFINGIKEKTVVDVNYGLKNILSRPAHLGIQIPMDADPKVAQKEMEKLHKVFQELQKNKNKKGTSKSKGKVSSYDQSAVVYQLKKGISLIYRHNPIVPTSVFQTYLKGGLSDENTSTNGSYNLISSMFLKGNSEMDESEIKNILETESASLQGFSGKNAYGLNLHCLSSNFPEMLDISMNCLLNSTFPQKKLSFEKEMTNRNLESQKEDPIYHCFRAVNELLFYQHPYSMNVLGTKKSIRSLSRKMLETIHTKNLKRSEIVFTYCGNLDAEEVIGLVSSYLTDLKDRAHKESKSKKITPLTDEIIHIPFDREQTQIFIGLPTGDFSSFDNIILKMITTHLSGLSSELFVDVRDKKGLCYTVQPIHFTALEGGYWGIYMASGHDKVVEAIDAITEILKKYEQDGISEEAFNRIKKMIEGQNLLNLRTNEDYANTYSIPYIHGFGIDHFYKKNKKISELNYERFNKELKKILARQKCTVLVGRELES
ncbi:MAG: insulinase family protein [Bdellovibrionales bacterium]|jgi:zinc protease|nr:insulinase family protein [Bdellovibrionales bacterium]